MRWADELIIPVPDRDTQEALAAADDQLASFQADLRSQRQLVWSDPDSAGQIVSSISPAFDRSLTLWLDTLPYPIASALWTAETAASPSAQQKAYIHAWEAIVAFHATVLLSASRSDPSNSSEIEGTIRQTLRQHNLGIERASIGTWIIIAEKTAKNLRNSLE